MPRFTDDTTAVEALLDEHGADYVTVALVDQQGQLRGKSLSRTKFLSVVRAGLGVVPMCHMLDFNDVQQRLAYFTQQDSGFEDSACRVDLDSMRVLPWEPANANLFFFLEFAPDCPGNGFDPRALYRRMLAQAADEFGVVPYHGFEWEFRLFAETADAMRARGFHQPKLIHDTSGYASILRHSEHSDFFTGMREICDTMTIPVDSLHWETGCGFAEASLGVNSAMPGADDGILFKVWCRTLARKMGMTASFMARFDDTTDGSSGHVHLSLRTPEGEPIFHDPADEHGMSARMRHFIGGVQRFLPELILMLAPNVNSYKRFAPGIFTPLTANWGIQNRTCAIRVFPGSANSQRLELRVPGADANPYLALAFLMGTGMRGMREGIEPTAPATGNTWRKDDPLPPEYHFPTTFTEAIARFRASPVARELFGDEFVQVFAGFREEQDAEFRRLVSNRELERFLELA